MVQLSRSRDSRVLYAALLAVPIQRSHSRHRARTAGGRSRAALAQQPAGPGPGPVAIPVKPPVLNRANELLPVVAPPARRVPRTHGRIRRPRLQSTRVRICTGSAASASTPPSPPSKSLSLPGAGAGCARGQEDGRPDRHAVQGAVRSANGVRRRRRRDRSRSRCAPAGRSSSTASSAWSVTSAGSTPPARSTASRRPSEPRRSPPTCSRRRSSASSTANSTRAAAATGSPACTGPTTKLIPQATRRAVRPVQARRQSARRGRRARHAEARRPPASASPASCRRGSTTASRWRCSAARSAPTTSAPGPATGSCARRSPAAPRSQLTGEYNFASGDEDPADNVRGTFDQLYPTPHDKYRPRRPDRLEEHAPRPRRVRGHAASRDCRSPRTITPGGWLKTRDAIYNVGSAVAGARRHGRRRSPRRSGARRPGQPRAHTAAAGRRRLRAHLPGRVPQGGHARRLLQPPLRHGSRTSSWRRNR